MKISLFNPSNHRYYNMYITKDLFGDVELAVVRGSRNRHDSCRYYPCDTYKEAYSKFTKLVSIRKQHGYQKFSANSE